MNTGMQDAFNLGWKLAFTLRGWSHSSALLNSYEQERLPAIRQNIASTERLTRTISRLDKDLKHFEPFLPKLKNRKMISQQLPLALSGLALRYSDSTALGDTKSDCPKQSRVGTLNLGLGVLTTIIPSSTNSVGPLFKLVVYGLQDPVLLANLTSQCQSLGAAECIMVMTLEDQAINFAHYPGPLAITAVNSDEWQRLGAMAGELEVIRPDGIVSYVGQADDIDGAIHHVQSILGQPPTGSRIH